MKCKKGNITLNDLRKTFEGKRIKITHTGECSSLGSINCKCKKVHRTGEDCFDFECINGNRYGITPDKLFKNQVEGSISFFNGKRRIQVV